MWYYGYMRKIIGCASLGLLLFTLLCDTHNAHAEGNTYLILNPNILNHPLDIEPFVAQTEPSTIPKVNVIDHAPLQDRQSEYKPKGEKPMEEKIMAMIPYSDQMKYLWNVADGDIDLLGIKGLRGDRRNKGVEYKTNYMPLIGAFDDTEFKFEAGEDMELSFNTSSLPFGRSIEGFNFNGSVGDDARVSARYTVKFD